MDDKNWLMPGIEPSMSVRFEGFVTYMPVFVERLRASDELRRQQDAAIGYGLLGPSTMEELSPCPSS